MRVSALDMRKLLSKPMSGEVGISIPSPSTNGFQQWYSQFWAKTVNCRCQNIYHIRIKLYLWADILFVLDLES